MKIVYAIRQGLFSDGHTIFKELSENFVVKNIGQAPLGHPAREHNLRIPKSCNRKEDKDLLIRLTQAKGNLDD